MKKTFFLGFVAILLGAFVFGQTKTAAPQQQTGSSTQTKSPAATGAPATTAPTTAAPAPIRSTATQTGSTAVPTAASVTAQRAVLDQYCVTCHSDRTKRANLTLEKLDLTTVGDHPELWEKVIRKLRAGVMRRSASLRFILVFLLRIKTSSFIIPMLPAGSTIVTETIGSKSPVGVRNK